VAEERRDHAEVCVVGVGAQTAVGLTAAATAAAVRAGISGLSEDSGYLDRFGEPVVEARVPEIDEDPARPERIRSLALGAAREAMSCFGSSRRELPPVDLILGLPPPRLGRTGDLETGLTPALRAELGVASIEYVQAGHAAGLMALETALGRLATGERELCLIGGADSYLAPETLASLEEKGQLHGGENAYGFIPGEGAGFCLIARRATADRLKLLPLARVVTCVSGRESQRIHSDSVCTGKGLTEVFRKALRSLPSSEDKIDQVICDMNGEPYRADEYGFASARLSRRFVDSSEFIAPADCWGDVGAASGPLYMGLAAAAGQKGYAAGPHYLLWASSEGGERSAAIIRPEPPQERVP
jgi:3-oxoacyl-[acyl-carrier-protein] synthase-1